MNSLEWKSRIVEMVSILREMAEADSQHLWEYHLPAVAASEHHLAGAERVLGFRLDPHYRDFLGVAGGWQTMYQMVDVFGPQDLAGGERMKMGADLLSYLEEIALEGTGYRRDQLLPIACSRGSITLFVMAKPGSPAPGTIIWFEGTEIDRFATFDDFFLAMMEYNRRQVVQFKTGRWPE